MRPPKIDFRFLIYTQKKNKIKKHGLKGKNYLFFLRLFSCDKMKTDIHMRKQIVLYWLKLSDI